jgi:hypothetical protein
MSNVQFNLSLAVEADQTIVGLLSGNDLAALSADSAMEISVSSNDLSGVFKFQTDSDDLTDASAADIQYACDSTNWPDLSFSEGAVAGVNSINSSDTTTRQDMLRHVAKDIFGTHYGVDLLSNEEEIQEDIDNLDTDLKTAILTALDDTGGTTFFPKTRADATGNYAKEVLDKLIYEIKNNNNDDARIRSDEMLANANGGFHNFVFKSGDSLTFKVTYNPSEGEGQAHGEVSTATMSKRSYLVKLNVSE